VVAVLSRAGYRVISHADPVHALAAAASSDPLLPKPFVAEDLLHAVRDLLDEPLADRPAR
jgi:hypothetical protein